MTTTKSTRLDIGSWEEQPYRELSDGRVLKQAAVHLSGGGEGATLEGDWNALLYYNADGTSSYVGVLEARGTLDGHTGSFVMMGEGTYDGTTARMTSQIVPGSGTDGLSGITGRAEHESTHQDYPQWPLVLIYDLG